MGYDMIHKESWSYTNQGEYNNPAKTSTPVWPYIMAGAIMNDEQQVSDDEQVWRSKRGPGTRRQPDTM